MNKTYLATLNIKQDDNFYYDYALVSAPNVEFATERAKQFVDSENNNTYDPSNIRLLQDNNTQEMEFISVRRVTKAEIKILVGLGFVGDNVITVSDKVKLDIKFEIGATVEVSRDSISDNLRSSFGEIYDSIILPIEESGIGGDIALQYVDSSFEVELSED
jgi:hypothetical protein